MCSGFPRLGVLRRLRPTPGHQRAVRLPNPTPAGSEMRGPKGGSRVHVLPINEGGTQLYPDGSRTYAADLRRGLPHAAGWQRRAGDELQKGPVTHRNTGPDPPGFEPAPPNEASTTGSLRIPSRLARQARTVWQYRHVPPLSGPLATQNPTLPTGFRLPSASPGCCDNPATKVSHLRSKQHAPHGALWPGGGVDTGWRSCRGRWRR
jgi:hypothetical protein